MKLKNDQIELKILQGSDAPRVLQFYAENKDFFQPWFPTFDADFFTIKRQKALLKNQLKALHAARAIRFWMEKDGELIGFVALSEIIRGPFQSCFLSYATAEKHLGKGYAASGVEMLVDFAFNELQLHRIEANIMPSNTASIALVEKLGFIKEGISQKYLKINGQWEDHLHYVKRNSALE